jgi:hypothetical protein
LGTQENVAASTDGFVIGLPEIGDSRSGLMLLYGDAALERIEVDVLGVREFAVKIAQSMLAQSGNSGLVYGLEGTWGSGKSSIANEILWQCLELHDGTKSGKPIIVRFDPWILRGVQPLVGALLEEIKSGIIQASLDSNSLVKKISGGIQSIAAKGSEYRQAVIAVSEFSGVLAEAALLDPTGTASPSCNLLSKAMTLGARFIPRRADEPTLPVRSLKHHKHRVSESIRALNRQLIITIDDIDRLDPEEIMEVLRLVRSVADFSNTVYLLNYDPRIVASASKQLHGGEVPSSYLEKIVNIPIRVPVHEPYDLVDWFKKEIDLLLRDLQPRHFYLRNFEQGTDLDDAISEIGRYFLKTPRDVARVLDCVRIGLGSITKSIWLPDLVWISIIRIRSCELHAWIERYLSEFSLVGSGSANAEDHDKKRFNEELASLSLELGLSEIHLRDILRRRIPGVGTEILGTNRHPDDADRLLNELAAQGKDVFVEVSATDLDYWRQNSRIGSPDHYRLYFSFLNPRMAIQENDVLGVKSALSVGRQQAIVYLQRLDDQRVSSLPSKLEKLFEFLISTKMNDFEEREIKELVFVIAEILDDTKRFEEIKFSFSRRGWRGATKLLKLCLSLMNTKQSNELIDIIFRTGKSLSWLTYVTRRSQQSQPAEDSDTKLSTYHFELAKSALLRRYSEFDAADFKSSAMPASNLFAWVSLAGEEAGHSFFLRNSVKDEAFLDSLELLINVRDEFIEIGSLTSKQRSFIDPDLFARFFVLNAVTVRLKKIAKEKSAHRIRAEQILKLVEEGQRFSN